MHRFVSTSFLLAIFISIFGVIIVLLVLENRKMSQALENDKKSIIVFFNTSCNSCERGLSLWEQAKENGILDEIQLIGISNTHYLETLDFINRIGITFPVVIDSFNLISNKYNIKYVPLAIFIDKKGKIRFYQKYGQTTDGAIAQIMKLSDSESRD